MAHTLHAVLVGVPQCTAKYFNPLPEAHVDLNNMGRLLEEHGYHNQTRLIDGEKKATKRSILETLRGIQSVDVLVAYFATHGVLVDDKLGFVVADTDDDFHDSNTYNRLSLLYMDELGKSFDALLKSNRAKRIVGIFDTCQKADRAGTEAIRFDELFQNALTARGIVILYACPRGSTTGTGPRGGHFTNVFIEAFNKVSEDRQGEILLGPLIEQLQLTADSAGLPDPVALFPHGVVRLHEWAVGSRKAHDEFKKAGKGVMQANLGHASSNSAGPATLPAIAQPVPSHTSSARLPATAQPEPASANSGIVPAHPRRSSMPTPARPVPTDGSSSTVRTSPEPLAHDQNASPASAEDKKRKQTSSPATKPASPEKRQKTEVLVPCKECGKPCVLAVSKTPASAGKRYWGCPGRVNDKCGFSGWWQVPADFAAQHTAAELQKIAEKMGILYKAKKPKKQKLVALITKKQQS